MKHERGLAARKDPKPYVHGVSEADDFVVAAQKDSIAAGDTAELLRRPHKQSRLFDDGTSEQSHQSDLSRQVERRRARKLREQARWQRVETEPVRDILSLHEKVFGVAGGIEGLTAQDIFGDLYIGHTITKQPGLIEQRLANVQASAEASTVVNETLSTIYQFLQKNQQSVDVPLHFTSEYREHFPKDDKLDVLLRDYLRALFDWFGDNYNASLDQPQNPLQNEWQRRELRDFLMDGLHKCLLVIVREFKTGVEMELGQKLDDAIQQLIRNHFYNVDNPVAA